MSTQVRFATLGTEIDATMKQYQALDRVARERVRLLKLTNQVELAEIDANKSKVEALQAAQRLGEAEGDRQLTELKRQELIKRLEQNQVLTENSTSQVERQQLLAEKQKLNAEREKLDKDYQKRVNDRAVAEFDLQRKQIQTLYDLGIVDQQTYNKAKLDNDLKQQDLALKQQNIALEKLSSSDKLGRETVLAKIAEINGKKEQLIRESIEVEKKRILTDYDEQLTELDRFNARKLISESDYYQAKTANQIGRADAEIAILTQQSVRLGKADKDGREAIQAQISKLQIQKIKILEEGYANELTLIKDREARALDLVLKSEQQRAIDLQKLVNNRTIRLEDADRERNRQNVAKQRAELKQAQDFEAALARTANAPRSPDAERAYQQQVRDARAKTLQSTLNLLQTEGSELERLRTLALKRIEDEGGARTRAIDLQLSEMARVRGERERQVKDAEANTAREVAAIEIATKALERQSALLTARNNLAKANSDAKVSKGDLEIERLNQALAIRKELESGIIPYAEYQLKIQRLEELGVGSNTSILEIQRRKLEVEQQQSGIKLVALNFEQAAAKAALTLEQQKIDLANQRLLIEARIAEFKARQAVLDARSIVNQTEENNLKLIAASRLALTQAEAQQPGRERDRAIADAKAKLAISNTEAETSTANALQGVDLARQQVDLTKQTTQSALEQIKNQAEVKKLQLDTLDTQQRMVLEQFKAAEGAKMYANELERAKIVAEQLTKTIGSQTISTPQGVQTLPARAGGGSDASNGRFPPVCVRQDSVSAGQAYVVGEKGQEVFVPNVSGTVLNREQILKNLGSLGGLNVNLGAEKGANNRAVIDAIQSLEQTIQSRPPTPIVANFNAPDDGGMDKLFALQRSSLRLN